MPQMDVFDSLFGEGDDDQFGEEYLVVATFPAQYSGQCNVDYRHTYKRRDIVGKLENASNPFIPVQGVCCNKCVNTITHKRSVT